MAYMGRIETGTSKAGWISPMGDYDTYNTTFIAGLTYSVAAKGSASGSGTLADPNLSLYNSTATQRLLYNDDINPPTDPVPGENRDAQLTFKIGQTGVYKPGVGETGNNATGSYTLTVSAGYATNGNDRVTGTASNDAINGMAGDDLIYGMAGFDNLVGGLGNDTLLGGDQADWLIGQAGNDVLRGQNGNDALVGGMGADNPYGGTGADRFIFNTHTESNRAYGVDVIAAQDGAIAFEGVGFAGGDVIDLRGIDANAYVSGNQAFVWSASAAAGTVSLSNVNGNTVLNGHVNNDRVADFTLIIADGAITAKQYTADEFLL